MEIDFVNSAIDIVEGVVAGGLLGVGSEIISSAVASFPNAFISTSLVAPLSVVVGALTFVGYSLHNIRNRVKA